MATTWHISKIKRDEVYWHNLGVYADAQSSAETLFKHSKEVNSMLNQNRNGLVYLEDHLHLSFRAALTLFENHPDGGMRACYDMEEVLDRALENISGISIEVQNGYYSAIVSYKGPHDTATWEITADPEHGEINRYVRTNFQRIDNKG